MNIFNKLVVAFVPAVPKQIVRRFANRYIAGETLDEAVGVVRQLNEQGMMATLDVLGEDITTREEATAAVVESEDVLRRIASEKLDANLSVKLSSIGLKLDKSFCLDNTRKIVQTARSLNNFVRIDMEDSTCTTDTIDIYTKLSKEMKNVGIVLQAYMKRSAADTAKFVPTKSNVRLCKGIYNESPEIAFKEYDEINKNYVSLLRTMLEGKCYVGIATHDTPLVESAFQIIREMNLQHSEYEFQMLLGVRKDLRDSIVRAGHRMRIYVPFGKDWYGYSIRRFRENPQVAGQVFRSIVFPWNSHS